MGFLGDGRAFNVAPVPVGRCDPSHAINGPHSVSGGDRDEAHVGASIRRGCAHNTPILVLRWTDRDDVTAVDTLRRL